MPIHNPDDPWHYPRADLARSVLDLTMRGPANALTLFAPRRTGKTQFLLRDLGPLADAEGHPVVYASFWQMPLAPAAVLLHETHLALERGSFVARIRDRLADLRPRIRLAVPGAEIDLADIGGSDDSKGLLVLDEALDRLAGRGKPALLMLDEVQEIARDGADNGFVAALRTSLDKRTDRLKTVFTGSSREGLRAMFSAREAPFFHFATPIDLPELEAGFVDFLLDAFEANAGRRPDRDGVLAAFERLHRSPYFVRRALEAMLLDARLDAEAAAERVHDRIAEDLGYAELWLGLAPLQRAVARLLAEGAAKPFAKASRERLGVLLDEAAPSASRVQTALARLQRLHVADAPEGTWRIADPALAAWIAEQDEA